jgi:hypothetical protein
MLPVWPKIPVAAIAAVKNTAYRHCRRFGRNSQVPPLPPGKTQHTATATVLGETPRCRHCRREKRSLPPLPPLLAGENLNFAVAKLPLPPLPPHLLTPLPENRNSNCSDTLCSKTI